MAALPASQLLLLSIVLLLSLAAINWLFWRRSRPDAAQRKRTNNGRTFRVRGIPADWDTKRLTSLLMETFDLVPTVTSLAQEIQTGVQSATVSFQAASDVLRMPEPGTSIRLPRSLNEEASRRAYLQLDDDFHGMTTLFTPPEDDHRVE